jgi:hypothetical protein
MYISLAKLASSWELSYKLKNKVIAAGLYSLVFSMRSQLSNLIDGGERMHTHTLNQFEQTRVDFAVVRVHQNRSLVFVFVYMQAFVCVEFAYLPHLFQQT